jgi:hypothetical protein
MKASIREKIIQVDLVHNSYNSRPSSSLTDSPNPLPTIKIMKHSQKNMNKWSSNYQTVHTSSSLPSLPGLEHFRLVFSQNPGTPRPESTAQELLHSSFPPPGSTNKGTTFPQLDRSRACYVGCVGGTTCFVLVAQ